MNVARRSEVYLRQPGRCSPWDRSHWLTAWRFRPPTPLLLFCFMAVDLRVQPMLGVFYLGVVNLDTHTQASFNGLYFGVSGFNLLAQALFGGAV